MKYDVCIIGGGAAGLAAAASFNKNLKICILEKNGKLGSKIAATGGGKCNLTNRACPNRELTENFFKGLGLLLREDREGRFYPYTERASDVVRALEGGLGDNVTVKCGYQAKVIARIDERSDYSKYGGRFLVAGSENIFADNVILATGGKAGPQFGTTGDGYAMARAIGHTVNRVYPILSGIECSRNGVDFSSLKGIRTKGKVSLFKDGRLVKEETGEIQFTDRGLSGICVFNLTPYIKTEPLEKPADAMKRFELQVDFAPEYTADEIKKHGSRFGTFGIITSRLSENVSVEEIKGWNLKVEGVRGWKEAQATAGGVALDEIDMETMESKIARGLFFGGEVIDVHGPCGGFNLQNAWETGIKVAQHINRIMEGKDEI